MGQLRVAPDWMPLSAPPSRLDSCRTAKAGGSAWEWWTWQFRGLASSLSCKPRQQLQARFPSLPRHNAFLARLLLGPDQGLLENWPGFDDRQIGTHKRAWRKLLLPAFL